MKKENLTKVAVAVALLFAVNMEADAQFGNLLNKAKKVVKEKAEKVMDGSSTSSITSSSSVKDVVTSVAAPVDKPWTMSYESQSKVPGYLEHMEDVSSEEVAMLRDQWDIKRNALGVILYRVAYGYYIVKDDQGRKAVSHSWAQDYQGGKYGSLRHFGVGAEGAFYVK